MSRSKRTSSLPVLVALVALALASAPALAIVTYDPANPTNPGTSTAPFTTPGSDYYGMNWSYNYLTTGGTSVAIGYFTLLTASHYYMNVGYTFTVNGDTFRVSSMDTLAPDPGQAPKAPDLRVVHVENLTNQYRPLPGFYDLYTGSFSTSASLVVVGTGYSGSTAAGAYYTDYTDTPNTRGLRWGTNRYDSPAPGYQFMDYTGTAHSTQCIKLSYSRLQANNPSVYESGLGIGDSGGGMFIKDGGIWKLAAISLYRDYYQPPDKWSPLWAASIPYYSPKLYNILKFDLLPGDLNLDGNVDATDFITLKDNFGKTGVTWYQGDFNNNGVVDYADLFALQTNFNYKSTPHPYMTPPGGVSLPTGGVAMPEPTTLLLLSAGAVGLAARRRRRPPGGR